MLNIDSIINNKFPDHPFQSIPSHADYHTLMANYLAMSQAFPYLQSGSQSDLFFSYMEKNRDIPEHVELTTVVGNFLSWDETGGLNLTLASGLKALPRLLETKRFHTNLLKKDCEILFGYLVKPDYSSITQAYLRDLYKGLADLCPVTRVANMVAFEAHANKMIDSLWQSVVKQFNIDKNKLPYFAIHVGGDDPAEPYHVAMTQALIEKIVKKNDEDLFISQLLSAYQLNLQWCAKVVGLSCEPDLIAV